MEKVTVDVSEAQTHLRELLDRVNAGAQIILSENEKPIARLVPVSERIAGLHAGSIWTSDDSTNRCPAVFGRKENETPSGYPCIHLVGQ